MKPMKLKDLWNQCGRTPVPVRRSEGFNVFTLIGDDGSGNWYGVVPGPEQHVVRLDDASDWVIPSETETVTVYVGLLDSVDKDGKPRTYVGTTPPLRAPDLRAAVRLDVELVVGEIDI